MNFEFYIFGTPSSNRFDLYPFDKNQSEIDNFRQYESRSRENVKRVIRYSETHITYSYLRYSLLPASNIKYGSFLGIAITFKKEYCTNIEGLYKLFNSVLEDLLSKKKLIQKTSNGQIKFTVNKLEDVEDEIQRIEKIVQENIEGEFESNIIPINAFKHINKIVSASKMNIVLEKESIVTKMETNLPTAVTSEQEKYTIPKSTHLQPVPENAAASVENIPTKNPDEKQTNWLYIIETVLWVLVLSCIIIYYFSTNQ